MPNCSGRSAGSTRGLSALFWGLPAALIICAETARADWLKPLGIAPALATNGLLLYGLWQMGSFQKQERPWRNALDRAKLLGLVNFGLCPFLYWHNKMPAGSLLQHGGLRAGVCRPCCFLFNLNVVLKQLGAMLPDETLRQETRQFTVLNRWLLVALLLFATAYIVLLNDPRLPVRAGRAVSVAEPLQFLGLTLFCPAAAGHDHGADLENQGSHPRQRLWQPPVMPGFASSFLGCSIPSSRVIFPAL